MKKLWVAFIALIAVSNNVFAGNEITLVCDIKGGSRDGRHIYTVNEAKKTVFDREENGDVKELKEVTISAEKVEGRDYFQNKLTISRIDGKLTSESTTRSLDSGYCFLYRKMF